MFLFFCYGVHHQVTYMYVITTWCNLAILFLNTLWCVGKGFSNYLCIHYTQTELLQQRPTLLPQYSINRNNKRHKILTLSKTGLKISFLLLFLL